VRRVSGRPYRQTQDIVDAVLHLIDAQFTTGAVLPMGGGATACKW
jgi:hypothetical protein